MHQVLIVSEVGMQVVVGMHQVLAGWPQVSAEPDVSPTSITIDEAVRLRKDGGELVIPLHDNLTAKKYLVNCSSTFHENTVGDWHAMDIEQCNGKRKMTIMHTSIMQPTCVVLAKLNTNLLHKNLKFELKKCDWKKRLLKMSVKSSNRYLSSLIINHLNLKQFWKTPVNFTPTIMCLKKSVNIYIHPEYHG
ncbi:unnamed protein product [Vicia faba]|uniref:Uncharacterized protein n=1 Tax=Vicia faba TaxID=3906 RepID=A0AAV0YIY1_VICFA|nr:unnamed protein product [Vicia faba]